MYNLILKAEVILITTTVYADVLFFVNFSMDYITLWLCALLTSKERSALRLSLASAIGALYAVISLFFTLTPFFSYICAGCVSVLMSLVAFGMKAGLFSLFRQSALIWGCSAMLGGIMTAILSLSSVSYVDSNSTGPLSLVLAAGIIIVWVILRLVRFSKDRRAVTLRAEWKGQSIEFSALCDSGNLLRDPLSGDAVVPVSRHVLDKLCGKELCSALLSMDKSLTESEDISLRIIPHRDINSSGIICGFLPDRVSVITDKKKSPIRCILAPRDCPENYFSKCAASIHPSLIH